MSYLVTGGTGLIGSRIVRNLVKEGGQVVVYDLFPEGSFLQQMLTDEEKKRVKIFRGDVLDLPNLLHTIKNNNVEKIIHLAALLTEAAEANPQLALKVICEGTNNIFEAARILGLKKVVWASSASIYGAQEKYGAAIPNDAPHYPTGIYGACKSFDENMALHYSERYGMDICGLRYCVVYGPERYGGASFGLTRELIENPALGKPGKVPLGDAEVNWLYAEDAASATVLAAKAPRTKTKNFNTSGDVRTVKEVADYVRKLLPGADITLLPGRRLNWRYDTSRIEEELGFRSQWTVERSVKDMISTIRKQHGLPPV
ncbi:MAG: NAD(P)-dependent oxidoreductase [Chloroflexi bacterium]|nr:NAD(P)-dependent oxidoreductase [Chloroflexota bacterium]